MIHFDHWWNPAVAWQAEDRAHRKGQKETVNVYSFWIKDTVEERIHEILEKKGLLHQEIIDSLSVGDFDEALTIDDLLKVFDLDRGSVRIPETERTRIDLTATINEITQGLGQLSPGDFENAVMHMWQQAFGYANARVTGRSGDGGIDIEATKITRGKLERIIVQCKRWLDVCPAPARELLGVLASDPSLTKGYLVTSGRFTNACSVFCQKNAGRLEAIDGVQLARRIREFHIKIPGVT